MGSFYVNITARTSAKEAANFLKDQDLTAYIMPTGEQECVIYEERCDTQDIAYMYELLQQLTAETNCSALGVLNHDDDMLFLILCTKGEYGGDYSCGMSLEEIYADYEGYEDEEDEEDEELDNEAIESSAETEADLAAEKRQEALTMAKALSDAFDGADTDALLKVLMQDFVFAVEVHENLAELLDLPDVSIGLGYNYIDGGLADDELDMSELISVDG